MKISAIRVTQPIGEFYLASIPVHVLLETCYSEPLQAKRISEAAEYEVEGAQRPLYEPRLRKIAEFIDTEEAAFPNSIILGANSKFLADEPEFDERYRWSIEATKGSDCFNLIIPSLNKMTSIIDGQHRLFSFPFTEKENRMSMEMACSVFFDLPKSFQAYVFATINSNQKPVSKSQTYELFGYNVEDEPSNRWSPDKLAVFLARRLNSEPHSPLERKILLAAENDFMLSRSEARKQNIWMVSFASVVKGIAKLTSQSPERDGYALLKKTVRKRIDLKEDNAPLRKYYRSGNDQLIYTIVLNYLIALKETIWSKMDENSYIVKTSGFQAIFDLLRMHIAHEAVSNEDSSVAFFSALLSKADHVNFSDEFFSSSSGAGAIRIRRCLEICLGFLDPETLDKNRNDFIRVSRK